MSTADGRLLLYTNGWELFDSTHSTFQNWIAPNNGYYVNQQFVQGNLLLPINDSLVYLFGISGSPTSGSHLAQYYARINLNANGGIGAVESSHNILGDSLTEHFAAIRDATNEGWWILSHKTWTDRFIKWHVARDGSITKSFQQIGGVHPPLFVYYIGQMVFSPQGDRMAVASERGRLEYYSFDRCTGDLALLNTIQKPALDTNAFYGVSFSPNGKLLYTSSAYWGFNTNGEENRLFQYELDSANILATQRRIYTTMDCDSCRRAFGQHKLGPDGKIYVIQAIDDFHYEVKDTLMVINSPDSIGLACDFDPHGFVVKPGKTNYGLPNIPDYRLPPIVDQVADCGPDILLCKEDSVRLGVPDTSATLTFLWWPATGLSDPTVAQPWASPASSVTYHLMVVDTTVHSFCDNTTDSVRVEVVTSAGVPVARAGRDTLICAGLPVPLGMADTSGGAWAYLWSPSAGLSNSAMSNPTATVTASQQYILTAYRPGVVGDCQTDRDTVTVTVYDPSVLPLNPAGPNVLMCLGDTVVVGQGTGAMGLTYIWRGAVLGTVYGPQMLASPSVSASVSVVVIDSAVAGPCGVLLDTAFITVEHPFSHAAPSDTTYCPGECFVIGVSSELGVQYNWSPVVGLSSPNASLTRVRPTGTLTYTLTVTNPALHSANCRERRFPVTVTADDCHSQSFITVNGNNVAELLDVGDHAGRVELRVWDMAGRLVHADMDYRNDWNATGASSPSSPSGTSASGLAHGMYAYRLSIAGECLSTFTGRIVVLH